MTPIRLGIENKRQVYLFVGLCLLMLVIAGSELQTFSSTKSTTPRRALSVQQISSQDLSISRTEPKLRITRLSRSEQVTYAATGRDIFSVPLAPVHIESPIAPARPLVLPAPQPERPKIPAFDIKYLGYAKTGDTSYKAVLVRGDDTLLAGSGDVIFHRFKVSSIQPTSVQLTDLNFKTTELIAVSEK